MKVTVPLAHAKELLRDHDGVTWTEAQLLSWWNEAQRVTASVAPRASVLVSTILLAANETLHSLPAGYNQVLALYRNMGADGATPGAPIRVARTRETFDDLLIDWHSQEGEASVTHYFYDPSLPRNLWTYPRTHATTAVHVQGGFSVVPADVTDAAAGDITISDDFEPAALQWLMYRALVRDTRRTAILDRALHFLMTFAALTGLELRGDVLNDPRLRDVDTGPTPARLEATQIGVR